MSNVIYEARCGSYEISTDPARLDLGQVVALMRTSYWAAERTRESTEVSVRNSRCFGLYDVSNGRQIGLTRVVTDYATFAWICDVIVEEAYRGSRLGVWMMETVLADPQLSGVRRWTLATRDAHELYARFGFNPLAHPGNWMEIRPGP
ncbi:MAG TPA: GNAT family N-acetyltransferase [Candidatus Baltobacteraceae bacterium]|jgi:GNAT superfamily N-acetyltransferase|nr:GNAT family N-acetyltransferase [Candidatus Baltobacteraceae bacterium]